MKLVERWRAIDPSWKFALTAFVVARVGLSAWAFLIVSLFPVVVQNLDLFGAPVLAHIDLVSGERYAYSREMDGVNLTFRPGVPGSVIDNQTGSVWSLRDGRAESGNYSGRTLSAAQYSAEDIFPYFSVAPEQNLWLSLWQRFDVNWYLSIAERGYGAIAGDVHFPPLYPLLIRLGGIVFGHYLAVALVISNLAMIVLLRVLYQMTREVVGAEVASRTLAYLLIFPTAFFCFTAYTEPLFLLAALLALRTMQQRMWLWAGFWIFCAILLRLQGIALLFPLAYAVCIAPPTDRKIARSLAFGLPAFAMALYLAIRFLVGDPSFIPMSETNLHARLAPPWENYIYALQTLASGKFILADGLNLAATTLGVIALIVAWRRMPMLFNLYAAASLIVLTIRLVDAQPLNSMSRYALTLFPMFIAFANWGNNPWVNRAIVYLSFPLQLYLSAQFVLWGWVG